MINKLILTLSIMAIVAGIAVSPVSADEAEQSQQLNQEFEVECSSSGTYGQDTNCKVTGKQEAEQHQRIKILGVTHDASKIGAGLDSKMTFVLAVIMIVGFSSTAVLVKNKIS